MKKLLLIILLITAFPIYGQNFQATVNKSVVGLGERLQVDFTFNCQDINSIGKRVFPAFEDFKVLSGPNTSQSMQIINGKVSSSISFSFILSPKKKGNLRIGIASIVYNGKTYTTNPLNIKVGNAKKNSTSSVNGLNLDKNVFIRATVNKTKVYKGEQLIVTYKLYTKLNISSPQISKLPTYSGFWSEDLKTSNSISFNYEMYKGERFNSAVIKKVALFPNKSGELIIDPLELKIPVVVRKRRSANSLFDEFFNDSFFDRTQTIEHVAKSNKIKITVKDLPSNAPESFTGAVGQFSLSSSIDKKNVKQNDAVTIETIIKGEGNIKLVDLPELILPAGFEKYDPKKNEIINRDNKITGSKTIEYLIVPRVSGINKINPIMFTYFDPVKKEYVTLKTDQFVINVERSESNENNNVITYGKEDVQLLSKEIRFIHTVDTEFERKSDVESIGFLFYLVNIIPYFVAIIGIIVIKRIEKNESDVVYLRNKKAEKVAKAKLKEANLALKENKIKEFYEAVSVGINTYLENKLLINKANYTKEEALNRLRDREVEQTILQELNSLLEICDIARFVSVDNINYSPKEIYEKSVNIIVKLEEELKK